MASVVNWNEEEVGKWLENNKLSQYKDIFNEHNITGLVLFDLTYNDLKDMGIESIGERAKILLEIKNFYYILLNTRDNNNLLTTEINKNRETIIENYKNTHYNYNDLARGISNKKLQSIMMNDQNVRKSNVPPALRVKNRNATVYNPSKSKRSSLIKSGSFNNNLQIPSRTPSISPNSRAAKRRSTNINLKSIHFNNFNNPQSSTNRRITNNNNSPLLNRALRNTVMNNNNSPVRNSAMPKKKINSIRYATRASILDIYGEMSNYFPVKENDEVVKRARETANRVSIMLEKVEQRYTRDNLRRATGLTSIKSPIKEEPEPLESGHSNRSSPSGSPTKAKHEKMDDILINNIINSDKKKGMKTAKSVVTKYVIKSQEIEKKEKLMKSVAQKQVVVKKSSISGESNKTSSSQTISSPSPLRSNIRLSGIYSESPSEPQQKVRPTLVPIKTKVMKKFSSPRSGSPSSATSIKSSPRSGSPSSAQQHRSSHIVNTQDKNFILVSPGVMVHTTLEFPLPKENKESERSPLKEENKINDTDITITKSSSDKTMNDKEKEIDKDKDKTSNNEILSSLNEEYNDKPKNWIKGKLIGQGSYGKVYYGINLDNNQIMAIKQVDIRNKMMVDSLNAEIDLLRGLRHENIVNYYGSEFRDTFNVFLEYVSGGSVASMLIRFGKFNESLIKSLTSQILAGLEYLHNKKIIHRDIKGANILVDEDGIAKISDFGISKKNEYENAYKKQSRMSVKGTVYWMAPEVVKGKGYSAKVDIWSVGCCVLEMFTGTHPWINFNDVQPVIYKLCTMNRPDLPDSIGEVARDFIDKSLSINPDERPTASELLKHQFVVEQDEEFDFHAYYDEALEKERKEEEAMEQEEENAKNTDDDEYEDIDEYEEEEVDDYFDEDEMEEEEEIDDYFDESAFEDDDMICKDDDNTISKEKDKEKEKEKEKDNENENENENEKDKEKDNNDNTITNSNTNTINDNSNKNTEIDTNTNTTIVNNNDTNDATNENDNTITTNENNDASTEAQEN